MAIKLRRAKQRHLFGSNFDARNVKFQWKKCESEIDSWLASSQEPSSAWRQEILWWTPRLRILRAVRPPPPSLRICLFSQVRQARSHCLRARIQTRDSLQPLWLRRTLIHSFRRSAFSLSLIYLFLILTSWRLFALIYSLIADRSRFSHEKGKRVFPA